ADLIFCATASTEHVIGLDDVKHALAFRQGRPLVIVDLGVPRDVDPAIGSLDGVKLLDIDSVRDYVDLEMSARVAEVAKVNAIIEEEVARYLGDSTSRQVAPLVASLRERLEEIRLSELSKAARRLGTLDDSQRTAVESLTKAIIAKALHEPTIRLKSAAGTPRGERLSDSLRELFDLR
ncbi:MAG TPA: hypothetical protein VMU77_05485, partial [Acidimicrobiales bacterium]|nr:hypothetical protein [Acidimicrobiales bacterium]